MVKHTGMCSNCGNANHPKGNVFRIMSALYFEIDFPNKPVPAKPNVKVCNNCDTAHPFHQRTSAKAKKREELIKWLDGRQTG